MKDASQVLDYLRHVLIKHMDATEALPEYRVARAIVIGKSGRMIGDDQITAGNDVPAGLRLMMRSGDEYDLTLS